MTTNAMAGTEVHRARLAKLGEAVTRRGLDAALITSRPSLAYYTGLWGLSEIRLLGLVVTRGASRAWLATPAIEAEYAERRAAVSDLAVFEDWNAEDDTRPFLDALSNICRKAGLRRIGVEFERLPVKLAARIESVLPEGSEMKAIDVDINAQRAVKDLQEAEIFRRLGELALVQFEALRDAVAPGVPEYELSLEATNAGTRYLAEHLDDDLHSPLIGGVQILTSGPYMSMPHKQASARRLETGDLIQPCFCNIDRFHGYSGSFGRVISVGPAREEDHRLHEVLAAARRAGLDALQPGRGAREVYEAVSAELRAYGAGRFLHRHGRGLGLGYAEIPDLSGADETVLAPGMVTSLEPALYQPGQWGQRIEDIVFITEDGNEVLTEYPPQLVEKA